MTGIAMSSHRPASADQHCSAVWIAEYCSCCHESAFEILSVNATAIGAWTTMRKHRLEQWELARQQDLASRPTLRRICRKLGLKVDHYIGAYNRFELWRVRRIEVNP